MLLIYIFVLLLSFYLLSIVVDEFFIDSLDIISKKLKLSSDVAGATFMAMGSSSPELFTSLIAVLRPGNNADLGAGTIVGSAIFNILVIIGASALFKRAKLSWQPIVRDTLFYSISIIILMIVFWDGKIILNEALLFVGTYFVYLFAVVNWKKWIPYHDSASSIEIVEKQLGKNKISKASKIILGLIIPKPTQKNNQYIRTFLISILLIGVISYILVESAVGMGGVLNINPTIIALTVLAAGTSIPDLISSVIVAKRGRGDMAVSNAIGSNIFDILFGLGVPWLIVLSFNGGAITVGTENLVGSIVLLFATVISVFFILFVRKWTIGRKAGLFLIGLYILYLFWTVFQVL